VAKMSGAGGSKAIFLNFSRGSGGSTGPWVWPWQLVKMMTEKAKKERKIGKIFNIKWVDFNDF